MSLQDLYSEAKEKNSYTLGKCVVALWALSLSDADKLAFETSLGDDDFTTKSLFLLYKNAGASFGLTSLKEHRNGTCSCR
jgi:hypothetical protein